MSIITQVSRKRIGLSMACVREDPEGAEPLIPILRRDSGRERMLG